MSGPLCLEALHNAQQTSRWKLEQMNATKPNLYLQEFADLKTNLSQIHPVTDGLQVPAASTYGLSL